MKALLFGTHFSDNQTSLGLLLYRLVFGGFMLIGHGWGKLTNFSELSTKFPDPLGMGSAASLASAVTSEVVFALMIVLGLATRAAAIPLIFTMIVAGFVVHADGPFFLPGQGAKEPALMYLAAYALLLFTGPGKFSLDAIISKKLAKS